MVDPVADHRWRPQQRVRPIAVGLAVHDGRLLLEAVRDDAGGIKGWRPPGGAIEFGERAADAVVREFHEEMGEKLAEPRLRCVIENIFSHHGSVGHEVVFIFDVDFVDPGAYRPGALHSRDNGVVAELRWLAVEELRADQHVLFPEGLSEQL